MKFYSYKSNLYSTNEEFKNCIVILAINKKEAQKWAKQFPGLVIGDKVKTKVKEYFSEPSAIMKQQADILEDSLNKRKLYIKVEE